ncbi:Hemicentin-1 [Mactra antiquata]
MLEKTKCSQLSVLGSVVGKRELECHQCCTQDYCNLQLCGLLDSGKCENDVHIDCARLDSLFQICQDIPHARLVCPQYCYLCYITDGRWSSWSSWSTCSVTCDSGNRTRTRQCNNPTPSYLGEDCKGLSTEISNCSTEACPVHGRWTNWSSWSACSVSCDIGLQHRDRACTISLSSSDVLFCHGDSRDDRTCSLQLCADGNWSMWSDWSVCSTTCGNGLKSRHRQCDNPKPSILGSYCAGDSLDVSTCFIKACHDGGWSVWGTWSVCSLSCGGGIQSRSRTCSNPVPSERGQYCSGASIEVTSCNGDICPGLLVRPPNIIFQARTLKDLTLDTYQTLIFTHVMRNEGHGYNSLTGKFTAPVNGAYIFTFQFCVYYQKHFNYEIVVDNAIHTSGYEFNQDTSPCSTGNALITLNRGQSVWIKASDSSELYESSSSTHNYWNIFSGLLVHE